MEARNQVVKIEFKNDIRLVEIEDPNEGASILKSKISNLYSIPSNLIQLKVKDDDGDLITVESNADWRTVIRVVAKPRVLVMQEVSLVQASEVVGATLAKRQIKFNFKGNLIRIELNVERLEKLGLAHLGDGALSEKINQEWKLKELLRFGLAEGPQVIAAFTEVGLTPPPRFLHKLGEFASDGSGPEMIHPHVLQEHSHHKHFGFAHRGHHPHHPHPHHRFGRGFHHRQHFGHGAFHAEPVKEDDAPHSNANVEPTTQKLEELAVCDEHQSFWKGCRRSMVRFVKHVTIVDGEAVQVDTKINKMWRVRNDSNEPWPEQVELIHIGGDSFGFTAPVAVRGRVAPGTECDINVELIVPSKPGLHDGYFRLREVNGKRFGQRIWISVRAVTPTSDSEDYVLATPSEVAEFPDAESQLKEMGFVDSIRNRELLNRYRGNVERVVARLTNADGCQFAVATNDLE